MNTTLNKIKAAGACEDRYKILLKNLGKTKADDEEITIRQILISNGIQDAIWALRAVEGKDKEIRLFACDCAEMVLPIFEEKYPDDMRPRRAIEVSRRYANEDATKEELIAVWLAAELAAMSAARAAGAAAGSAVWSAARAAMSVVELAAGAAAGSAVWSAVWSAARAAGEDIEKLFMNLIH